MVDDTTLETVRIGIDRARTRFVSNARIGVIADSVGRYELINGDVDRQVITVTLEDGDTVKANRGTTPPVAGEPVTVNKRNGQYYIEGVATLPTRSDAPRALATVDAHSHNKGYLWFSPIDAGSLVDGGMEIVPGTTTFTLKRKLYRDDTGAVKVYAGEDTLDTDNYRAGIGAGQQRWAIVYVVRSTGAIAVYEATPVSTPANTTNNLSAAINECLDNVSGAYPYLAVRVTLGSINYTKYKPASGYNLSTKDFIRFDLDVNAIESLGSLTDVTLTSETTRDVLYYNGTSWVNQALDADDIQSGQFSTPRIADLAVTSGKIATGAVGSTQLAPTTVTAGTYNIASVTLDPDGRATAASSYLVETTTDPSATDDSYNVGTLWVRTDRDRVWQCVDDTSSAAVWQLVSGIYGVSAGLSANQSVANNTLTSIVLDATTYDPDSMLNTSTGVITIPRTGLWTVSAGVIWDSSSVGSRLLRILGGGSSIMRFRNEAIFNSEAVITIDAVSLASKDKVEYTVQQISGGALNVLSNDATYLNVRFLGEV